MNPNEKNGSTESLMLFHLARSLDRLTAQEDLIRKLWVRIEREHTLLNSALHELAASQAKPGWSKERFISDWYRKRGGLP